MASNVVHQVNPRGTPFDKPTMYTQKRAERICREIMMGRSLKDVCKASGMPSMPTVCRWLADPRMHEFREMYYNARRCQAEILVDEIMEIADDSSRDYKKVWNSKTEDWDLVPDNEHIQRSRVRIDTRKWFACKMLPKIYGDLKQVELDVTGDLADLMKGAVNRDNGLPKPAG